VQTLETKILFSIEMVDRLWRSQKESFDPLP